MRIEYFEADQSQVLSTIIRQIPGLSIGEGNWVAGGAARRLFERVDLGEGDIDLFTRTGTDVDLLMDHIPLIGYLHEAKEGSRNPTYAISLPVGARTVRVSIQVIQSMQAADLAGLFASFDMTVCCFATDGRTIAATSEAVQDLAGGWLRPRDLTSRPKRHVASRISKYCGYGFTPTPEVFEWMMGPSGFTNVSEDLILGNSGEY